jgi:hypothetical protein
MIIILITLIENFSPGSSKPVYYDKYMILSSSMSFGSIDQVNFSDDEF